MKKYCKNIVKIGTIVLIAYIVILKLIAINSIDFVGDELFDLRYGLLSDVNHIDTFFETIPDHDQARLPFLIGTPITLLFEKDNTLGSLVPMRILFVAIHFAFLYLLYKTVRLKFPKIQAQYYIILVALSAYLFSFSIFSLTTSNNLYLLFATATIYFYLKNIEKQKEISTKTDVKFSLIAAACIASRLFGVIILIAIFIYDLTAREKKENIFNFDFLKIRLEKLNIAFTVILIIVATSSIPLKIKFFIALLLSSIYLSILALNYLKKESYLPKEFISKWLITVHTVFNLTIILSPTYLNFRNILSIFNWFTVWNSPQNTLNNSHLDIMQIIIIKNWPFIILALISFALLYYYKNLKEVIKKSYLFILISLILFIIYSSLTFTLAWYPLLITYLLLIPISAVVTVLPKIKSQIIYIVVIVVLLAIPTIEHIRYIKLFPYGHIDGAQYGEQYRGWNKPGFISFEYTTFMVDFYKQNKDLPLGTVGCNFTSSELLNKASVIAINQYLEKEKLSDFRCLESNQEYHYYITSLYTNKKTVEEVAQNFDLVKTIFVKNIPVSYFWVKK